MNKINVSAAQATKAYVEACHRFERARDKFREAKAKAAEAQHDRDEAAQSYQAACKLVDDAHWTMTAAVRVDAGLPAKPDVEPMAGEFAGGKGEAA